MPVRDLLSAASGASAPSDPDFEYVSLLLNGDGTNGAQNNTFLDSSTNNFTITRNGNTTQGSFSPYGSNWSNYFNGSSYLQTPSNSAFNFSATDCTIEFWYFGSGSGGLALEWGTGASGDMQLEFSSGTLTFGPSGGASKTFFAIQPNTWNHIAAVKTGTTYYLYINGTRNTTSSGTAASSATTVNIGGRSGGSVYITGYLSNLRITNNVVYTGTTLTVPTTPLTAISGTQLLTCQSNRFIDNSSNAFALTVNGTPSVQRFSPFNPTAPYSTSVIGGSGYFDGSGDYLGCGSQSAYAFGTGNFTLECWAYATSLGSYNSLVGSRSNSSDGSTTNYSFGVDSAGGVYFYSAGFLVTSSAGAIKLNSWNHIALVRSGTSTNQSVLYVNGVSAGTGTISNNLTGTSFAVGGLVNGDEPFAGYITNVRLNNTALYSTTFTPPTTPLSAVSGTSLLTNFTNAGIPDLAMQNDLETVGNAQVSTSVKKYGTGSLAFDGTGDYLKLPSSSVLALGSGNFTIEAWIYGTTISGSNCIIDFRTGSSDTTGFYFGLASGQLQIYAQSSINILGGSVSTNTWTHVAVVRNNGTVNLYINGTSVASGSNSTNWTKSVASIGAAQQGVGDFFFGNIDDLRITNGLARYTANFTPPASALPTY